ALPAADQAAVARALSRTPENRFPSCSDFVHALAAGQTEVVAVAPPAAATTPAPEEDAAFKPLDLSDEYFEHLRLLDCIRRTPLTEVHRAERADGGERLVTILFGCGGREEEAAGRLTALQHPALTPVKAVRDPRRGLILITAPAGQPLRDRFQE